MALIVATAGILATHYAAAPALIPIHWDANGHANGFADKSVGSFYLLVWVQLIIYVLLTALTQMFRLARLGMGVTLNFGRPASWLIFLAILAVPIGISVFALVTTHHR